MDVQQFEQAILQLAFETDARISTASVAYYLGIPSRRANELLNALLEEGVLELDSDADGNLYYRVPHKPDDMGDDGLMRRLRDQKHDQVDGQPAAQPAADKPDGAGQEPSWTDAMPMVSADDDDDRPPVSPMSSWPQTPPAEAGDDGASNGLVRLAGRRPAAGRAEPSAEATINDGSPNAGLPNAPNAGSPDDGLAGGAGSHQNDPSPDRTAPADIFAGVTRRRAKPDASLNRCGASPMVVSDAVRCDPKPLASRQAEVTRCAQPRSASRPPPADRPTRQAASASASASASTGWHQPARPTAQRQQARQPLFNRAQSKSTMLAPTASGELAVRDDELQRPEHQPGMALLLSLILCGTGQIYNGEVSKGIMMMVLCFLLWFVLLGWVVHIWSIVDSVVVAERLNRKAG